MSRPKGKCSEPDCQRPIRQRGLCFRHYVSAHERGELPPKGVRKASKVERICEYSECQRLFDVWPYQVQQGHGRFCSSKCKSMGIRGGVWQTCASSGCDKEFYVQPYSLKAGGGRFCSQKCFTTFNVGAANGVWVGENISASGAHGRCRKLWGSASQYPCIECGKSAREWAYDGTDPTQRYGSCGSSYVFYSAWPEFYMPMCSPCHRRRDVGRASAELQEYRWFKQIFGDVVLEALSAYCDARDAVVGGVV